MAKVLWDLDDAVRDGSPDFRTAATRLREMADELAREATSED